VRLPPVRYNPDLPPPGTFPGIGDFYAPLAESPDGHWALYLLWGDGDAFIYRWHDDVWLRDFGFSSDGPVVVYELSNEGLYYGSMLVPWKPVFLYNGNDEPGFLWNVQA